MPINICVLDKLHQTVSGLISVYFVILCYKSVTIKMSNASTAVYLDF